MPRAGEGAVVVVNHLSFLDGVLLGAFLPGKPTLPSTAIAKSWIKPFLKLFKAFPVDPTNPMAAKAMVRTVREGACLVIFPEGRITVTGALMKVFDGPGMVADKANAPIIRCASTARSSRRFPISARAVKLRWFPKVSLTVLPPRRLPSTVMTRAPAGPRQAAASTTR
jgi:acyl-[acyl-carrier-protein]-phospholipid O-acyltransferase/long-chain-fatty-acid--[acyl-carrier-protein] ligase